MSSVPRYASRCPRRRGRSIALVAVVSLLAVLCSPVSADALEDGEFDGAVVYLVNLESGRYLDGDGDGSVKQSLTPKADDRWVMSEVSPGVYNFYNTDLGRWLDADGADRDFDVNLSDNNFDADTQWQVIAAGDGIYEIVSAEYGQWLDADYGADYQVNLTTGGDEPDARWYIALANPTVDQLDGATVLLSNASTGRYLDGDANTVDQSVAPKADDYWVVEGDSSSGFTFRSVAQDRLLHGDLSDVSVNGSGGFDTIWDLNQRADGSYEILNGLYGQWLDADYADQNYNVDLTPNGSDVDAAWHILVLDTDLGCVTENFAEIDDVLLCINAGDAFVHLQAWQDIADANGGIRASGTPGYDASADYVATLLEEVGLIVTRQEFDFSLYTENSVLLTADGVDIETQSVSFAAAGGVLDGQIVPVDLDLGLDNASTSGCEAEDFDAVDLSGPTDVVLVQRGACAFADKALNAQAAGAEAVVIFNQGNTEDRKEIIGATLGSGVVGVVAIPVLDISYDDGVALTDAALVTVALDATTETNTTENIIADFPGLNPGNVVMTGAHLDSVTEGPGIQDNGTGSAALLTIALALANNESYVPQNSLRFAWWGAEESGLIGSTEYIFNPDFGISDEDYAALAAYVNFDMVASPNHIFGVYDADESTFVASAPVPPGSAALEDLFEAYYTIEGVPYDDSEFSGRSDYQAFISVGIPASGLFTGAEGIKTDLQASIWGGTVGDQYDPCYHLACDTIDNVAFDVLEENIDAIAYALINLAASTEAVNGVAGTDIEGTTPDEVIFDGPQGTFVGELGGGASDIAHGHPLE